jgi:hypothetical protein
VAAEAEAVPVAAVVPAAEEEAGKQIMKKHITKILLIPLIGLLFSGCYTTLWMPDGDYDSEDIQTNEGENFYPVNDYGDYYYFYNRPWWYTAVQTEQAKNNRTKDASALRNTDSGRNTFKREGRTTITELPTASLPTVSAPASTVSASTTTNTSSNNSTNRAGNSNSSNNNSNPVRNNDGNRNTSGR